MKKSKFMSFALASILCVSTLTACSSGTAPADEKPETKAAENENLETKASEEATSDEPITLRFSWWGGESRHEATIAACDLYMEKNPHVTIEVEYSGWDGYKDKLVTQLAGGTAPDIIQINYDWIHDLRNQDQYFVDPRDLSDIIDLTTLNESAYNGCWVGEELQGIPSGLSVTTLITNKPFYETYGLDSTDPNFWTWDKVLEEGTRINKENPEHYLLNEFPDGSSFVKTLLAQQGKEFVTEDYEIGCTEEELIDALNTLRSYIDNGVMLPFEESSIYAQQTEQFPKWLNNEMGMFMQVASTIPSFADMDLDVMRIPQYEDSINSGASMYPTNIIAINSKNEYIDESAKFVDFFLNDSDCAEILLDVRGVPATEKARNALVETGLLNPLVTKAIAIGEANPGMGFHPAMFNTDLTKIQKEFIEIFGFGEATAEETAENVLTELEEICATLR